MVRLHASIYEFDSPGERVFSLEPILCYSKCSAVYCVSYSPEEEDELLLEPSKIKVVLCVDPLVQLLT
jgi:hypothetical protein